MIGNKQFDCPEMFRCACAFAEVADMANEKFCHDTADIEWYTTPGVVNAAFACEVFLKTMLKIHDIEVKKHELKALYDLLPEHEREWIKMATINNCGQWTDICGREILAEMSDAFVKWRYVYEINIFKEGSIRCDYGFLTAFRNALREACCQLLFGVTWKKYAQL